MTASPRRVALGIVVGLVLGSVGGFLVGSASVPRSDPGVASSAGTPPVPEVQAGRPTPRPVAEPSVSAAVRLEVGDDFQRVVDEHAPGTTFLVAAGLHREQSVIPRDGDHFVGETGAILSGARDISNDAAAWERRGNFWVLTGQRQEGLVHGELRSDGNPRHRHPEELFVEGDRWTHVTATGDLGPGRWFLDYEADELWIGEDPAALGLVETSTTVGAFGGNGIRDVTIENLVVEKYATPAQHGAIGFFEEHWTHDWTLRDVTARDNHGAGIRLGPGMVIDGCSVTGNGQLGIGGDGTDRTGGEDGYQAPITVRGCEVAGNGVLDFQDGWEAGGVKVKYATEGATFSDNWIHDNVGKGLWVDIDNRDVTLRSNRVEDNTSIGIFYEISFGPSRILWNEVARNGKADAGEFLEGNVGILVDSSTDVEVRGNLVTDQAFGIILLGQDRGDSDRLGLDRLLRSVEVVDNAIAADVAAGVLDRLDGALGPEASDLAFAGNQYAPRSPGQSSTFMGGKESARLDLEEWIAAGYDQGSVVVDVDQLALPDGAVQFRARANYGAFVDVR